MKRKFSILGVALDALSSPERIDLKGAYLNYLKDQTSHQEEFKDPYNFVKRYVTDDKIVSEGNSSLLLMNVPLHMGCS